MQAKIFKTRKARWAAFILGIEVMALLLLKSCEQHNGVSPFDPDIFFAQPSDGSMRAVALWLLLVLLGLTALFVLFRVFASGTGSTLGKTVLASTSAVALILATQVPDDVKLPAITPTPKAAPIILEDFNCLDMACFDGGGPSMPATPDTPAAPSPNAGITGV